MDVDEDVGRDVVGVEVDVVGNDVERVVVVGAGVIVVVDVVVVVEVEGVIDGAKVAGVSGIGN